MTGFMYAYTDPSSGIQLPNAWFVMRNALLTNPTVSDSYTQVVIVWDIFVNQTAFNSGKNPIFPNNRIVSDKNDSNWSSYFAPSLAAANHDLMTQAYSCLLNYLNGL